MHLHVNNFGSINEQGLPSVIELSFTSSKYLENNLENDKSYPVPNLDMPNNKDLIDHDITFY